MVQKTGMANLTIIVNSEVLKRARIRALEENTSVNAVLNKYLEAYAREAEELQKRQEAVKAILELSDKYSIDREGKKWRRDELYKR